MRILSTLWRRFTILLSNLSGSFKILIAAFVQRFREPAARSGFKMDYTDICSIYERRLQCPAAVGCQVMGYTRYKRRAEVRITWPRCTVSYGLYSPNSFYTLFHHEMVVISWHMWVRPICRRINVQETHLAVHIDIISDQSGCVASTTRYHLVVSIFSTLSRRDKDFYTVSMRIISDKRCKMWRTIANIRRYSSNNSTVATLWSNNHNT